MGQISQLRFKLGNSDLVSTFAVTSERGSLLLNIFAVFVNIFLSFPMPYNGLLYIVNESLLLLESSPPSLPPASDNHKFSFAHQSLYHLLAWLAKPKTNVVIPKNQPLPKYLREKKKKTSESAKYRLPLRYVKITIYLGLDIII